MSIRAQGILIGCTLACGLVSPSAVAQDAASLPSQPLAGASPSAAVRGIYNWVHTTGDADRAYEFYHAVFGIELAPSPFYGDPNAQPNGIRTVAEAGSDALVWDLTNTHGSRFRSAFLRAGNVPPGLEIVEFFDIQRETRAAQPWDPGASMLIFTVRDLAAIMARARDFDVPVLTRDGLPIDTPHGRSIVLRNPDGYLIQAVQASDNAVAASAVGDVIGTSIGITVADTESALAFYRDLLGFEITATRAATRAGLRLFGLTDGELLQTEATIPATDVRVVLSEFTLAENSPHSVQPFQWQIQDVGAPQFQLQVTGLDALLDRTRQEGYRFLSVGGSPIRRPFGRFVFVIDADGVLVEFVEPDTSR